MDKEEKSQRKVLGWPEWLAICLGLAVTVGVAAILSPSFGRFMTGNATAAWVQALGSIGAIGVAIYVSQRQAALSRSLQEMQHKRAAERRSKDRKAQSVAVASVAIRIASTAIQSKKLLDDAVLLPYPEDIRKSKRIAKSYTKAMNISIEALGRLPIHELPYAAIARELLSIRLYCETITDVFAEISLGGSEKIKAEVDGLDDVTKALEKHRDQVRAFRAKHLG